jgi:hypothetical protein
MKTNEHRSEKFLLSGLLALVAVVTISFLLSEHIKRPRGLPRDRETKILRYDRDVPAGKPQIDGESPTDSAMSEYGRSDATAKEQCVLYGKVFRDEGSPLPNVLKIETIMSCHDLEVHRRFGLR